MSKKVEKINKFSKQVAKKLEVEKTVDASECLTDVKVRINPVALGKIHTWVEHCDVEVSGMGVVEFVGNTAYITDVFLVKQTCDSVETEMDSSALADLELQVIKSKCRGGLNFWWHSHVDMPVFWSGTDDDAIHQIGKNGIVVATVFNKSQESRTAMYRGATEFSPDIYLDDMDFGIGIPAGDDDTAALLKELSEKVTKAPAYAHGYGGWQDQNYNNYYQDNYKRAQKVAQPYTTANNTDDWSNFREHPTPTWVALCNKIPSGLRDTVYIDYYKTWPGGYCDVEDLEDHYVNDYIPRSMTSAKESKNVLGGTI